MLFGKRMTPIIGASGRVYIGYSVSKFVHVFVVKKILFICDFLNTIVNKYFLAMIDIQFVSLKAITI